MGKYRSTLCKVKDSTRRLTCGFVNGFDRHGTLLAFGGLLKPERKPRRGELASSWAIAFGLLLCLIALDTTAIEIDTAKAEPRKSIITVLNGLKVMVQELLVHLVVLLTEDILVYQMAILLPRQHLAIWKFIFPIFQVLITNLIVLILLRKIIKQQQL